MYTTLIEKGEKSSHPHNLRAPLPPSLHPPPSLFPPLVINLPMLPALLSVLSFCAHANSEHIPCHFLALFKNACLFLIFHCVSLGNKLAAFTPTVAVWQICQTHFWFQYIKENEQLYKTEKLKTPIVYSSLTLFSDVHVSNSALRIWNTLQQIAWPYLITILSNPSMPLSPSAHSSHT